MIHGRSRAHHVGAYLRWARSGRPGRNLCKQVFEAVDRELRALSAHWTQSVRTLCTTSRRPAGSLAPPTRRTADAPAAAANAGRLARKHKASGRHDIQQLPGSAGNGAPAPAVRIVRVGPEPVKSAFGVGCADLRLLTEPARKSRSRQLSGAGATVARSA